MLSASQIDDRQTPMAEADRQTATRKFRQKEALTIRPSVRQRLRHGTQDVSVVLLRADIPNNTAHSLSDP